MTTYATMHGIASSQAEEDALIQEGALIIIRTDLIDPPPPPPAIVLDLNFNDLTDAAGKTIANNGVTLSGGVGSFGSGYLLSSDHEDFDFNNENFCIEIEFMLATLSNGAFQHLIGKGSSSSNGWFVAYCSSSSSGHLGKIEFVNNGAIKILAPAGISDTTNMHVMKLERVDDVTSLYIDGNLIGSTATAPKDTTGALTIGAYYANVTVSKFTGAMDLLKITKG